MKKIIITAALLFSVGTVFAAPMTKTKPMKSWNCEDFLELKETYRPVAVKSIEIINEKATPNDVATDDIYFDTAIVETITPEVVSICQGERKASFSEKVNQVKAKHHTK